MTGITDDDMDRRLETVRNYCAVFLRKGPDYVSPENRSPEQQTIVREHGRRNMTLSDDGKLAIVGPIGGGDDIVGLCIFSVPEPEVRDIMEGDGAVQAGIFVYQIVTLYGFPGDALPTV